MKHVHRYAPPLEGRRLGETRPSLYAHLEMKKEIFLCLPQQTRFPNERIREKLTVKDESAPTFHIRS